MCPSASQVPGAVPQFLVRQPGTWSLTRLPAGDPVSLTGELVIDLLAEASVPPPSPLASCIDEATPLGADEEVAPVWMFVGLVARGGIVVEACSAGPTLLDAVDVRLLSAVASTTKVADLAPLAESELACRRRLGRLVALGCLHHLQTSA